MFAKTCRTLLTLVCCCLTTSLVRAQVIPDIIHPNCYLEPAPVFEIDPANFHGTGINVPSKKTLKILVIMAQFKDDNYDLNNEEWPIDRTLAWDEQPAPYWVTNPGTLFTPTSEYTTIGMAPQQNSVSAYFYEMTHLLPEVDRLRIYGDVVHYIFPFTREEMRTYHDNVGNNPANWMTVDEAVEIIINGVPNGPAGVQLPMGMT